LAMRYRLHIWAATRGGHLLEGPVWPTLEANVRDSPVALAKVHRPDPRLALINLP
jgi:predicted DNA-binding protein with PD1-like motif